MDTNNIISKTVLFKLGTICDVTSDFAFDRRFKLGAYKATLHTNSKTCHLLPLQNESPKEVGNVMATSQSIIQFFKLFFGEENQFLV